MKPSNTDFNVAFIDMGTNSARMMLVRINPDRSYAILSERKESIRLGEGEFPASQLNPAAIDRAILIMQEFVSMATSRGAGEIIAVATSATREARNQKGFLLRLREEAGVRMRVISGKEEARLIYLGVVRDVHLADRPAVFLDIGGGSTEIIVGRQDTYLALDSLRLGAIRLAAEFPAGKSGIVTMRSYSQLTGFIHDTAVRALQDVDRRWGSQIELMVGTSGTIQNLADIASLHFLGRKREPGDVLGYDHLGSIIKLLCGTPLSERAEIPGISPDRVDIIIPGAAILQVVMKALGQTEISISDRGLRDGLLFDYLAGLEGSAAMQRMSFRKESVLRLGRAVGFEEQHAQHVASLALRLFDSAADIQLHSLGRLERELLEYAALLHDIGISLSYSGHQRHSYYFIKHAELLGFNEQEIDTIATTTRYHRKSEPRKKHPEFNSLDSRSQEVVRVLSSLLSIAESLDRSHARLVTDACFSRDGGKSIQLIIEASKDCPLEKWGVEYHKRSFNRVYKHPLEVHIQTKSTP